MKKEYRIITDPDTMGFTIFAEGVTASCKHRQEGFCVAVDWENGSTANETKRTFDEALSWAVTAVIANPIMHADDQPEGLPESIPATDLAFMLEPDNHLYLCEHVGELKQDGKVIEISRTALSYIFTLPVEHGRMRARYSLDLGKTIQAAAPTLFALVPKAEG